MTPDERKAQGPLINGLKDRVNAASEESRLGGQAALDQRLNTEGVDVTLPRAREARRSAAAFIRSAR